MVTPPRTRHQPVSVYGSIKKVCILSTGPMVYSTVVTPPHCPPPPTHPPPNAHKGHICSQNWEVWRRKRKKMSIWRPMVPPLGTMGKKTQNFKLCLNPPVQRGQVQGIYLRVFLFVGVDFWIFFFLILDFFLNLLKMLCRVYFLNFGDFIIYVILSTIYVFGIFKGII